MPKTSQPPQDNKKDTQTQTAQNPQDAAKKAPESKDTKDSKPDPKDDKTKASKENKDPKAKDASKAEDSKTDASKTKEPEQKWYEGRNKEVVIYYLIAVFFLEIIVGAAAFFYGVANAEPLVAGGPRMAKFPWIGWIISATLAPVGLLLLFHLSGWFFTRTTVPTAGGQVTSGQPIPKNVEQFYSVVSNAPVVVVLLGLLALGGCLYFLDTALGTLRNYIPWILGSATLFLIIAYATRLFFLAKHRRMEREYEYRMKIFEKTGMIITDKNMIPLNAADIARAQAALLQNLNLNSLPEGTNPETKTLPEAPQETPQTPPTPPDKDQPSDLTPQAETKEDSSLEKKEETPKSEPTPPQTEEIVDLEFHEKKNPE